MNYLVSVDPGVKNCGVARWSLEGELLRAELVFTAQMIHYGQFSTVVVEKPQEDGRTRGTRLVDQLNLAYAAGLVAGWLALPEGQIVTYQPREWKNAISKEVHHPRILTALTAEEWKRVQLPRAVKTLGHNVLDAVGLGLFFLRRISKDRAEVSARRRGR